MRNFYLKIRDYRLQNNYSAEYIAIQMDMSVNMYLKIEKGNIDLKLSKLEKLVKILGIKKSQIFELGN